MPKDSLIDHKLALSDVSSTVNGQFLSATTYADTLKDQVKEFLASLDDLAYRTNQDRFDLDVLSPEKPVAPGEVDVSGMHSYPDDADLIKDIPKVSDVLDRLNQMAAVTPMELTSPAEEPDFDKYPDLVDLQITGAPDEPQFDSLGDPPADPEFTDIPEPDYDQVTFNEPTKVPGHAGNAPAAPNISDISIPSAPDFSDVSAPDISDVSVPGLPNVSIPVFGGIRPEFNLTEPDLNFDFTEGVYDSVIKDNLSDKINNILSGADPLVLSDDVINDILEAAEEQFDIEITKAYDDIAAGWSSRGWVIPPGAMTGGLSELRNTLAREKAGIIRDIGVKQSEFAIDAVKAALSTGTQYEGLLIEQFNQVQNRAFEIAKTVQDAALKLFETQVTIYNSKVDLYKAEAAVYETLVRGNLAVYEGYKAQMEGVKAQVAVQTNKVDLYTAQMQANEILSKIYESRIRGATVEAEIEQLKIEMFKAEIEGYSATVNAKTAEYSGYESEVRAELAKAQIAAAQSQNYRARVEGLTSLNASEIQKYQSLIDRYKAILAVNQGKLDAFKMSAAIVEVNNASSLTEVKASAEAISSKAAQDRAKTDAYVAKSNVIKNANDYKFAQQQNEVEHNKMLSAENQTMLESFNIESNAATTYNNAEGQRFRVEVEAYLEDYKIALANYEGVLKKYQADMGRWEIDARLALEEAKENVNIAEKEFETGLRASETSAKVYSQLAASSMGCIRANANISYTGRNNNNTSLDRSKAFETFSYQESYKRNSGK